VAVGTDADPAPPPRRRRRSPAGVRIALAWAHLLAALAALRVLATVAEWLPEWALADGVVGLGNLAVFGGVLAGFGLIRGLLAPRRTRLWRLAALGVLVLFHGVTLAVFPTGWLLAWLQTDEVRFTVATSERAFALTIDDGLDPATTPAILDVLAEHGAHATFFVLGESLDAYPELARRCLDEGHELANHQMTDTPAVSLEPRELADRMREADRRLRTITTPRWFRPGGGIATETTKRVAPEIGCPIALGSVFPFDSHVRSTRFITAYVAGRTGVGDIVVLHEGGDRGARTAAALDAALPRLAERGLRAVTLSELVDTSDD